MTYYRPPDRHFWGTCPPCPPRDLRPCYYYANTSCCIESSVCHCAVPANELTVPEVQFEKYKQFQQPSAVPAYVSAQLMIAAYNVFAFSERFHFSNTTLFHILDVYYPAAQLYTDKKFQMNFATFCQYLTGADIATICSIQRCTYFASVAFLSICYSCFNTLHIRMWLYILYRS